MVKLNRQIRTNSFSFVQSSKVKPFEKKKEVENLESEISCLFFIFFAIVIAEKEPRKIPVACRYGIFL